MSPSSWHHDALLDCLTSQFGGAVRIEEPQVDWDSRVVCRAVLPDGRRTFVKVDRVGVRHRRELAGLRAAHAAGAPVPGIVWSGRHTFWILVLEEIPTHESLATGVTAWRAAGAAVRRLHSAPVPAGMRMFCEGDADWTVHMLTRFRTEALLAASRGLLTLSEADAASRFAVEAFDSTGPLEEPTLLHGDLQARHLLVAGAEVFLVDFGDAGWGDPVLDLVVLTHWHPEHTEHLLDGYGATSRLRTRFHALRLVYSLWRHLFVSRWYSENSFDAHHSATAARRVLDDTVQAAPRRAPIKTMSSPPCTRSRAVPAAHVELECEAVLVDFDGLLIDTETAGWRSWNALFARFGEALGIAQWATHCGGDDPYSPWDDLERMADHPLERDTWETLRRQHRDAMITVLPGARELLATCRAAGVSLGLVSNSPRHWIERQMTRLHIEPDLFDVIVTGEGHPAKPAPDGYLLALDKLGVPPTAAVALEDSARGVAAANAAGVRCVAVPNSVTVHSDLSHAHAVVESLAHVTIAPRTASAAASQHSGSEPR